MKVRIRTAGALNQSMPTGQDVIEGQDLTVRKLIRAMVDKYGPGLEKELLYGEDIREGLSLLVNGRNILSMPEKYDTPLKEGDMVLIAILVAGG